MATTEALAIQCDQSLDRIESRAKELVGEGLTPIPRVHRDPHELRRDQLHCIADWWDRVETTSDPRLKKALALLDGNWTKAEMEAVLRGDSDG